jgi:hypothetical protein
MIFKDSDEINKKGKDKADITVANTFVTVANHRPKPARLVKRTVFKAGGGTISDFIVRGGKTNTRQS